MKAFCLAIAFLLVSHPAGAGELQPTGVAWHPAEPEVAQPGNFHWTVVDNPAGGAQAPAALTGQGAPARAALAQIRAETTRLIEEARRNSANVDRIRYDLRISCVVQQFAYEPDPLETVSMPWLWDSVDEKDRTVRGSVEMCDIDYSQKVRTQAQAPQMRDYTVSFPMNE